MHQRTLFTGRYAVSTPIFNSKEYKETYARKEGGDPNILQVKKTVDGSLINYLFVSKDVDSLFGLRERSATFETVRWRLRDVAAQGEPPSRYGPPTTWRGKDVTVKVRSVLGDDLFQAFWWNDMSVLEKYMGDINEN